jgi:hypothetical protein
VEILQSVLLLTLRYFQVHQGLIKLFFMQIGYGNETAIAQLQEVRQSYRLILQSMIQTGIAAGIFLDSDALDVEIAITSIIGTINWSLYDLLLVKHENIQPDELTEKLTVHILRGLGYRVDAKMRQD